jgi:hypothetical protein
VLSCPITAMSGGTFSGDVKPRVWIFGGVLTVWVPAVLIPEAPGSGCREPRRVPGWVTRLGRNRCPLVPWVQDPDSSPRAFHRAGGRSRSLNGRQNRYSHVTMGTVSGLSHDHGASRYDRIHGVRPESGSTTRVRMYLHYKHV